MWAIRMETYLEALDLWEVVEEDCEVPKLLANLTMAEMKVHKERRTRKSKTKACVFAVVTPTIFTKEIWDYLKNEYVGDERIKGMQILNLVREFEFQKKEGV